MERKGLRDARRVKGKLEAGVRETRSWGVCMEGVCVCVPSLLGGSSDVSGGGA